MDALEESYATSQKSLSEMTTMYEATEKELKEVKEQREQIIQQY